MSFFSVCPLPTDLCGIVLDFVYMADSRNYKRCIYEAQHYVWYATELCGEWCGDMRPSDYNTLVTMRAPIEIETRPLGYYHHLLYSDLFIGTCL